MKLSDRGLALILSSEGFRSCPYWDSTGKVWTIGFGSTKGVGRNTPCITRAQGLARVRREVQATYGAAIDRLHLPLNQNQYDSLCSFTYNLGPGAIAADTGIGRALRRHDWRTAANEMLRWDRSGGQRLEGLTRRRRAERALFLRPAERPDPYRALPRHERALVEKLRYHTRGAASEARTGKGARYKAHVKWRDVYKRKIRDQMARLLADGRYGKGGWEKDNRGGRYQALGRAVKRGGE